MPRRYYIVLCRTQTEQLTAMPLIGEGYTHLLLRFPSLHAAVISNTPVACVRLEAVTAAIPTRLAQVAGESLTLILILRLVMILYCYLLSFCLYITYSIINRHCVLYYAYECFCSVQTIGYSRDGHGLGRPAGRVGSKFLKCIIFSLCQSTSVSLAIL